MLRFKKHEAQCGSSLNVFADNEMGSIFQAYLGGTERPEG